METSSLSDNDSDDVEGELSIEDQIKSEVIAFKRPRTEHRFGEQEEGEAIHV